MLPVIGLTERDIVKFHDFRPGWSYLDGQRKSAARIDADNEVTATWTKYSQAIDQYEDGKIDLDALTGFERAYDVAEARRKFVIAAESYARSLTDNQLTLNEKSIAYDAWIEAGRVWCSLNHSFKAIPTFISEQMNRITVSPFSIID